MSERIQEARREMEISLNEGRIDQALEMLQRLKDLSCEVKLKLQSFDLGGDTSIERRLKVLENMGVPWALAQRIAQSTRTDEEALRMAAEEGFIRRYNTYNQLLRVNSLQNTLGSQRDMSEI